jgi:hypothetical protein
LVSNQRRDLAVIHLKKWQKKRPPEGGLFYFSKNYFLAGAAGAGAAAGAAGAAGAAAGAAVSAGAAGAAAGATGAGASFLPQAANEIANNDAINSDFVIFISLKD